MKEYSSTTDEDISCVWVHSVKLVGQDAARVNRWITVVHGF